MHILIWFHRDLRTHDHPALLWAQQQGFKITGVVEQLEPTCSLHKLKFWQETVQELQFQLQEQNIQLVIAPRPIDVTINQLIRDLKINLVITHQRLNARDLQQLERMRHQIPIELREMGDVTLFSSHHKTELSLEMLKPFTKFKTFAMKQWQIPGTITRAFPLSVYRISNWQSGGESAGLARLHHYLEISKAYLHYHETRNGLINRDDSSKFSPWLAWGALSPRFIFHELTRVEEKIGPSPGSEALKYELLWRDYFKFLAYIQGPCFFELQGLKPSPPLLNENPDLFEQWCQGTTAEAFVNAHMRELLMTGFMSNRGRQNVASYLAKTLKINWLWGAKWFEQQLIDEDPENNFGNWQYLAGVGTDPRDRVFNIARQAEMYDPSGEYQQRWLKN